MEKVIDIEDRIPTLKARRRKRTNKKFSILLLLFISTLLIVLYFQSSYSHIQSVKIKGASLFSEEQYIKQSTLQIGDSMWGFRDKRIEENIEQYDWVESIHVKRNWLTGVEIQVNEYKTIGYAENNDRLDIVLENGKFVQIIGQVLPLDGPIFSGFGEEKIRNRMIRELNSLDSEVIMTISQINYNPSKEDVYSIQVYMNDGNEVRALIPSFSEKMKFYPSIVSQLKPGVNGIIDLEVGSFFQTYQNEYNENEMVEEVKEVEEATP